MDDIFVCFESSRPNSLTYVAKGVDRLATREKSKQ